MGSMICRFHLTWNVVPLILFRQGEDLVYAISTDGFLFLARFQPSQDSCASCPELNFLKKDFFSFTTNLKPGLKELLEAGAPKRAACSSNFGIFFFQRSYVCTINDRICANMKSFYSSKVDASQKRFFMTRTHF